MRLELETVCALRALNYLSTMQRPREFDSSKERFPRCVEGGKTHQGLGPRIATYSWCTIGIFCIIKYGIMKSNKQVGTALKITKDVEITSKAWSHQVFVTSRFTA